MKLLESKVAIITGGSRGIGKSICETFAQNGCNVAFTYNNSKESAENLSKELNKLGVKAKAYKSDASNFDDATKLVEDVLNDFESARIEYDNFINQFPQHELVPSVKFELEYLGKNINEIPALKHITS